MFFSRLFGDLKGKRLNFAWALQIALLVQFGGTVVLSQSEIYNTFINRKSQSLFFMLDISLCYRYLW